MDQGGRTLRYVRMQLVQKPSLVVGYWILFPCPGGLSAKEAAWPVSQFPAVQFQLHI